MIWPDPVDFAAAGGPGVSRTPGSIYDVTRRDVITIAIALGRSTSMRGADAACVVAAAVDGMRVDHWSAPYVVIGSASTIHNGPSPHRQLPIHRRDQAATSPNEEPLAGDHANWSRHRSRSRGEGPCANLIVHVTRRHRPIDRCIVFAEGVGARRPFRRLRIAGIVIRNARHDAAQHAETKGGDAVDHVEDHVVVEDRCLTLSQYCPSVVFVVHPMPRSTKVSVA